MSRGKNTEPKQPPCPKGCSQQPCPHSEQAQAMVGENLLPESARGTKPAGSGS